MVFNDDNTAFYGTSMLQDSGFIKRLDGERIQHSCIHTYKLKNIVNLQYFSYNIYSIIKFIVVIHSLQ